MKNFREFWPFYVREHSRPVTRTLHFIGISLAIIFLILGAAVSEKFFIGVPLAGYGFAWIGHFIFEKNKPATFKYPLWSLRGDFQMYFLTLIGKMGDEVAKYAVNSGVAASPSRDN